MYKRFLWKLIIGTNDRNRTSLQKGGVSAAPSGTATLCDLAPITSFTLGRSLRLRTSGTPGFHGLTGGVYKAGNVFTAPWLMRLLANPASWSQVADSIELGKRLSGLASRRRV